MASQHHTGRHHPGRGSAGSGVVVRAGLLWVLVSAGLTYGVVETARKAAALFG